MIWRPPRYTRTDTLLPNTTVSRSVVDDHAGAAPHVVDDLHRLDGVLHVLHAALVHDREVGVEDVRVALGDLHPTCVGRHDHEVLGQVLLDVVDQHRHG